MYLPPPHTLLRSAIYKHPCQNKTNFNLTMSTQHRATGAVVTCEVARSAAFFLEQCGDLFPPPLPLSVMSLYSRQTAAYVGCQTNSLHTSPLVKFKLLEVHKNLFLLLYEGRSA